MNIEQMQSLHSGKEGGKAEIKKRMYGYLIAIRRYYEAMDRPTDVWMNRQYEQLAQTTRPMAERIELAKHLFFSVTFDLKTLTAIKEIESPHFDRYVETHSFQNMDEMKRYIELAARFSFLETESSLDAWIEQHKQKEYQ